MDHEEKAPKIRHTNSDSLFLVWNYIRCIIQGNKVISLLIVTGKQKLFISFCIILISCFNYSIYICGILDFFIHAISF